MESVVHEGKKERGLCLVNPIKSRVILAVVSSFYRDMGTEDSMQWKIVLILPLLFFSSPLLGGNPCRMLVAVSEVALPCLPSFALLILPIKERAGAATGMEISVYITPLLS